WFSKSGTLDITFTLFALLSFYFFSLSEEKRSNVIYSFICFSLAFLTKGIAALLIPMALGSYVLMRKERSLILNRYVLIGGIVSLTIIGSWYMPAYFHYGPAFLKGHFFQHFVERTVGSMDGHSGDWLTYINAILYKGKPWGVVGLISFPFFIFFAIKKKEFHKYPFISWIVVTYVIFTLVKTKLHWYIMPIYPALAIVAAWGVGKVLKKYAIFVVAICSLASVVYFGISKDIFTLDFNPEVKGFSYEVEKGIFENDKVYLYEIGDPGIRFYCGGFSENIYSKEELLDKQSENTIIIAKSGTLDNMRIYGEIIAVGPNRVRAVRVVKNNEG
ncbi:MAG: glycosyltransferase family 39 protein, partial [Candidatus Omnitrophica bacterium]|nr:glycosyltransferase family 39 protein [Candidatus Omnitrophota bacterium]